MKYNRVLFEKLHPHWPAGKDAKGQYEDPRMQQSYETWMACKRAVRAALANSEMFYSGRGEVQKAAITASNRKAVSLAI